MSHFTLTLEELEQEVNTASKLIISYLVKNELISVKTHNDFQKNMTIIIRRPSFFHQVWNKIKGYKNDKYCYIIVRQESLEDEENEDKKPELKLVKFPEKNE